MEKLHILVSATDKNFGAVSQSNDINGVVVATGKTLEELKSEFESALAFHIKGCVEDGDSFPEYILQEKYELVYDLDISALLLKMDGIVTLAAISRATGINQKQLGHYRSGIKEPRALQRQKIIDGIHHIGQELISVV